MLRETGSGSGKLPPVSTSACLRCPRRNRSRTFLLRDRIGEVFPAIVTGASPKGTYVRVKHPAAEGRVTRGERGLLVGDRAHVRLLSVDPEQGFIDFERT